MAKQSGIGANLYVGEYDPTGDIGAVTSIVTRRNPLIVTGIDKSAPERILGQRDGELAFTSFWNISAGQAHPVLSALPTTDRIISVVIGQTVGSPAASMVGKQITYGPTRGQDGSLVAQTTVQANGNGLDWGEMLTTGKQTFASGTVNGTSIDLGSTSTLFGAAAYLHVFSLGSGAPTVTVADSANDLTFAALSPTSLAFTPTVAGAERQQTGTAATIRRYIRVQITGTYTALVCALNFVRFTESIAT